MRRIGLVGRVATIGLIGLMNVSMAHGAPKPPPPPRTPAPRPAPAPTPTPTPPPPAGALPGLGQAELARFQAGRGAFVQPASVAGGLGPVFTEDSCVRCHGGPIAGGAGPRTVTRIGRFVGGAFDPLLDVGGPMIQDRGIGRVNGVNFVGEVIPPQATIVARRRTTSVLGLGLVDAVPDEAIVALARQQAALRPQTAGRPNLAVDPATGNVRVGRFGWKAQQPTLFAFAADAFANEMGVTTPVAPVENAPQGNAALLQANPARANPNEPTLVPLARFADYMTFLAPPVPAPSGTSALAGQSIFAAIGCADCHQPTWQTGPSAVRALDRVVLAPYSDFLLHDMGSLGDGVVQGQAGPSEMRTAPLWGLRAQPSLLHDGRASSPEAAVLAHDGQARPSRDRFAALDATQRGQLLAFLNSL